MSSSTHRAALPPRHVADAADAVDDRHVVPVAGLHLEQLGVLPAGRIVADRLAVADLDRVARIEADDAVVLDVHARHAVAGGRDEEAVVEADLERAGLDVGRSSRGCPLAEAEVPLADDAGRVAGLLQDRRPAWSGPAG